jgi:hypothetical protein
MSNEPEAEAIEVMEDWMIRAVIVQSTEEYIDLGKAQEVAQEHVGAGWSWTGTSRLINDSRAQVHFEERKMDERPGFRLPI